METLREPDLKQGDDVAENLPILRDDMAVHRTTLANERTFLSYLRTALTFFAAGVTFVKFFENMMIVSIGWVMIPVSGIVLAKGVASFRDMARKIKEEEEKFHILE